MSVVSRIWNLVRGQSFRWVSVFERHNPEALLELERENLQKRITQFNENLVSHAALSERLKRQVGAAEAQVAELATKIRALANAGQTQVAGRYALQHRSLEAQLDEDRKSLAKAEETFATLVAMRDSAISQTRSRIEKVRRQIGDVRMKTALADLEGMAADMTRSIGGSGDSFARIEQSLTEQQERALARSRVEGVSLHPTEITDRAAEDTVMGQLALDAFLGSTAGASRRDPLALPHYPTGAADASPSPNLTKTSRN
jgi:phage shock protein A